MIKILRFATRLEETLGEVFKFKSLEKEV